MHEHFSVFVWERAISTG